MTLGVDGMPLAPYQRQQLGVIRDTWSLLKQSEELFVVVLDREIDEQDPESNFYSAVRKLERVKSLGMNKDPTSKERQELNKAFLEGMLQATNAKKKEDDYESALFVLRGIPRAIFHCAEDVNAAVLFLLTADENDGTYGEFMDLHMNTMRMWLNQDGDNSLGNLSSVMNEYNATVEAVLASGVLTEDKRYLFQVKDTNLYVGQLRTILAIIGDQRVPLGPGLGKQRRRALR